MATKYHNRKTLHQGNSQKEADRYQQLCLWGMEEHQESSTEEPLDANTWLFLWGKEHGYPGIKYQFGLKGYYFSHGVAEDTWIHINCGYEHWEYTCVLGIEPYVSRAVQAIQTGKYRPVENKPIKPIYGDWGWEKDVIARLSQNSQPNETRNILHDMVRREALRKWTKERKYRELRYTSHEGSGYVSRTIEAKKEAWKSFLVQAVAFEIYCAYITTHTEDYISRFLEEKP